MRACETTSATITPSSTSSHRTKIRATPRRSPRFIVTRSPAVGPAGPALANRDRSDRCPGETPSPSRASVRSEEHTSELQSQSNLVCRLLLEKKKKQESVLRLLRRDTCSENMLDDEEQHENQH